MDETAAYAKLQEYAFALARLEAAVRDKQRAVFGDPDVIDYQRTYRTFCAAAESFVESHPDTEDSAESLIETMLEEARSDLEHPEDCPDDLEESVEQLSAV